MVYKLQATFVKIIRMDYNHDYNRLFTDLIFKAPDWVSKSAASRLQVAFYSWDLNDREEFLLFGKGNILGLVNLACGYKELRFVYDNYCNDVYSFN